jgi:hypothetical protein
MLVYASALGVVRNGRPVHTSGAGSENQSDPWLGTAWSQAPRSSGELAPGGILAATEGVDAGLSTGLEPAPDSLWTAPPRPLRRSGLRLGPLAIALLAIPVVIAVAFGAYLYTLNGERGQVMFTTNDPNGSCVVTSRVTSVPAGTHVWMVAMFKDVLGEEPVGATADWNGVPYWSYAWPVEETTGVICIRAQDLAGLPQGTMTVNFTRGGKFEMSGTLTFT